MFPDHVWSETSGMGQRDSCRKITGSDLDFMVRRGESICQRSEKRNVRRVCKIDPNTHR
jgi:hypothetical protein